MPRNPSHWNYLLVAGRCEVGSAAKRASSRLSGSWRQEYIDLNGGVGNDPIGSRLANRCETWHDESPSQKRASEAENYLPADRTALMHLHSARAAAARCRLQQRVQYLGAFAVSSGWPAVDVRACRREARIAPSSCCSNRDFTTRVGWAALLMLS